MVKLIYPKITLYVVTGRLLVENSCEVEELFWRAATPEEQPLHLWELTLVHGLYAKWMTF